VAVADEAVMSVVNDNQRQNHEALHCYTEDNLIYAPVIDKLPTIQPEHDSKNRSMVRIVRKQGSNTIA
jgi:hypothetical protein